MDGGPQGFRDPDGHMLYHKFYKQMHNQLGTHCCSDGDCRPTTARWDPEKKQWFALLDGVEVVIHPNLHVIDAYGLTSVASICAGTDGTMYCFVPPYNPG
jgi:hypothetical protein